MDARETEQRLQRQSMALPSLEDTLGEPLATLCADLGARCCCSPWGLPQFVLGLLAAALGPSVTVQPLPGVLRWETAARIWAVVLGASSTNKSTVHRLLSTVADAADECFRERAVGELGDEAAYLSIMDHAVSGQGAGLR